MAVKVNVSMTAKQFDAVRNALKALISKYADEEMRARENKDKVTANHAYRDANTITALLKEVFS